MRRWKSPGTLPTAMALASRDKVWLCVRLAFLSAVAFSAPIFFGEMHDEFDRSTFSVFAVAVLLLFSCFGVIVVLFMQSVNKFSDPKWQKPSWYANIVDYKQPVQSLHFGALLFLVLGTSVMSYTLIIGSRSLLFILPLSIGCGLMTGTKLSVAIFRRKFV